MTSLMAMAAFVLPTLYPAATITTESLLEELTDLERLAELPQPAYVTKQFSSYDRASKSPKENWFANGDAGHYLRVEERDGRKEHVMMDAEGPGAIVRIWSANPEGTLRIYIDGEATPALEGEMKTLLGGTAEGLPAPLAGEHSRGWNLYFPIPYAKHCKVTSDKGGFYYHVNYRTYEASSVVESFARDDLNRLKSRIEDAARRLAEPRKRPKRGDVKHDDRPIDELIAPGAEAELASLRGPAAVRELHLQLGTRDQAAAARATVLTMTFDGEETVECPIGDFFGSAPGLIPYDSLPEGVREVTPGALETWSHWIMPFANHARIAAKNLGEQPVKLTGSIETQAYDWTDRSLLFHAGWRIQRDLPTRPMTDWTHLRCNGTGRFVGGGLHLINPVKAWWGEGDEKIFVDGETFPSHFGTGTEDYYGYAWCSPERFVHAFHNQTICSGPGNYGNTYVSRFHVLDDIPFTTSFQFDIENWHWHETTRTTRAAVSYWYARPGGTDFFEPVTKQDVRFDAVPKYELLRVEGAQEGEALNVASKSGGNVEVQNLNEAYSGEQQLWWTHGKSGDKLVLGFDSKEAGSKHVIVRLTHAVDYGVVQLYVNGKKAGEGRDLYKSGHYALMPEEDLGEFDLNKGQNELTVEIVGANEKAEKAYMFGLDYLMVR